jgi:hypothetical protein
MSDSTTPKPISQLYLEAKARIAELEGDVDRAEERSIGLDMELSDELTREDRDLVRAQAIAMLAADTRTGVTAASGAVFLTIGRGVIDSAVRDVLRSIARGTGSMARGVVDLMEDPDAVEALTNWFVSSMSVGAKSAPAPAPSKPVSPIATPGDAKPASGVTAKKRAPKRKA